MKPREVPGASWLSHLGMTLLTWFLVQVVATVKLAKVARHRRDEVSAVLARHSRVTGLESDADDTRGAS
jgi:hypothetical protein